MSLLAPPWTPSERELERRRVRRRDRRRRSAIAALVTVAVLGVVTALVVTSPGWTRVRDLFFSPYHAWESFPLVLEGFALNVASFLIAEPLILVLGVLVAVLRTTVSPWLTPLRLLAVLYTDVFRGIPTLLVVLLLGIGVPALQFAGVTTSVFWLGTTALVLSYGAYVAEVVRAGIDAVHPSQLASAEALALSRTQTMRHVVLPRRCDARRHRCSTTSSRSRRTPRCSPCSASSRPSSGRRTTATTTSTSPRWSSPPPSSWR